MERTILEFAEAITENNPLLSYVFFFLNAVLQVLFPPYPGDSVVIFQGYLSSKGLVNPFLSFFITNLGTFSSSVFLFLLSRRLGGKLVGSRFVKKYFHTQKIYKLENWFIKYGALAIVINKFIPGLGSITLIGAGLFKLKTLPAVIAIGASATLHNLAIFMAGMFTGENMLVLQRFAVEYQRLILSGLLAISAIYIYLKYMHVKKEHS